MEWLSRQYSNLKSAIAGPAQSVADTVPLPSVATSEAPKTLGTAPEPSGQTVTGGRRHRKTRCGGKKRRTHRKRA
jgi:hypothetical protein